MGWEANEDLQRMIQYRVHNILQPLPMDTTFDLILCRNVLLYFDEETRKNVRARLLERLHPDGWLMLGAGETIADRNSTLKQAPDSINLYRRNSADIAA